MQTNRRHDWSTVQDRVRDRMRVLRMTQAELARRAGISEPTAKGFVTGAPRGIPHEKTRWAVCDALEWTQDSIDLILNGDEPVALDVATTLVELAEPGTKLMLRISRQVEEVLIRLAQCEARIDQLEAHRNGQQFH